MNDSKICQRQRFEIRFCCRRVDKQLGRFGNNSGYARNLLLTTRQWREANGIDTEEICFCDRIRHWATSCCKQRGTRVRDTSDPQKIRFRLFYVRILSEQSEHRCRRSVRYDVRLKYEFFISIPQRVERKEVKPSIRHD